MRKQRPDSARTAPAQRKGAPAARTRSAAGKKPVAAKRSKRTDDVENTEPLRLNRVIADAGVASRRAADDLIRDGRVRVNGVITTELGMRVGLTDSVSVNGEEVTRNKHLTYVVLNKPKDVITTSSDEKGRRTVFDLVRIQQRLFTVGRLDRNTTGVLLLTNDGDLAHRLMHPRFGVSRVYRAVLDKYFRADHAKQLAKGIELEDGPTQPCNVFVDPDNKSAVLLEIREGRNREVRRMFEALGYEVQRLDRKQYATISSRGLDRGEYRHLTKEEVRELRNLVNLY